MTKTYPARRGQAIRAAAGLMALAVVAMPQRAEAVSYYYDGIGGFLQGTMTGGHFDLNSFTVVQNNAATQQINQTAGVGAPPGNPSSGLYGTRDPRLPPNIVTGDYVAPSTGVPNGDAWTNVRWGLPQCGGVQGNNNACEGPAGGQSALEIQSQTGQVTSVIDGLPSTAGFVQTFAGVHYNRPIWFTNNPPNFGDELAPITSQPILTGGSILAGIALYRDAAKTQLVFTGLSVFPFVFNESLNEQQIADCIQTGLYAGHTHVTACDDAIQLSNLGIVGQFFDPLVNKFIGFEVLGFYSQACTPADACPPTSPPANGGTFFSGEAGDSNAYVRFRLIESDTPIITAEPATMAVFGSALAGLALAVRRRRRAA